MKWTLLDFEPQATSIVHYNPPLTVPGLHDFTAKSKLRLPADPM
jgi:hypothetical protein